jgi:hypothetical protein
MCWGEYQGPRKRKMAWEMEQYNEELHNSRLTLINVQGEKSEN